MMRVAACTFCNQVTLIGSMPGCGIVDEYVGKCGAARFWGLPPADRFELEPTYRCGGDVLIIGELVVAPSQKESADA